MYLLTIAVAVERAVWSEPAGAFHAGQPERGVVVAGLVAQLVD